MTQPIPIRIGGMAPPLSEQLDVPPETVEIEQRCLQAIVLLRVQNLLTTAEADKAGMKLAKRLRQRAANGWQ